MSPKTLCTWNQLPPQVKPLMDSLENARQAKADADASLKMSNDQVAAVEAKLQQLQDKFMEVRVNHVLQCKLVASRNASNTPFTRYSLIEYDRGQNLSNAKLYQTCDSIVFFLL